MKHFPTILTLVATLALSLAPTSANAQTVFFDDFDGNALLPHWIQPPAPCWEHNVSDSMLNVTGLFCPSHPKSPSNFADLSAAFSPQSDFQMDIWMGWEAGQQPHRLVVDVVGPLGGIIARMGYRNEFPGAGDPVIFAQPGNAPPITMPAPQPGIHHFTISRIGSQFNFYFNGNPFASFQDSFGITAAVVHFDFLGPYPGTLGAFHVDRVMVVPTPGGLAVLWLFPFLHTSRRRR